MNPEGVAVAVCGSSLVFDRVFEADGSVSNDKRDVGLCTGEDVTGNTLAGWLTIWLGSTITPGAVGVDVEVCERADVATLPGPLLAALSAWAF